ncbi:MAG: helicase-associated domain-containing protein [Isosphaeraceae bacterium]
MRNYSLWNRPRSPERREFYEKAFRREKLGPWDAKWHALSPEARFAFLNQVRGPVKNLGRARMQPSIKKNHLGPGVLEELLAAGFVELGSSRMIGPQDRVFAVEGTVDFAIRIRALARYHLLDPDQPSLLEKFVAYVSLQYEATTSLNGVVRKAGLNEYLDIERIVRQYVVGHRWPDWVALYLKEPTAQRILKVLGEADKPIRSKELPARLPDVSPDILTCTLNSLLGYLAVFEDLEPGTLEIVVGLLPSVRKSMAKALLPRQRPELVVDDSPVEVGPETSIIVDDLRAFLLEVASEPPRLRRDYGIFQKETDRFLEALDVLPAWLMKALDLTQSKRLDHAFSWARALNMVGIKHHATGAWLEIMSEGNRWLAASLAKQYERVYRVLREFSAAEQSSSRDYHDLLLWLPSPYGYLRADEGFLGTDVVVLPAERMKTRTYHNAEPSDYEALRTSLYRSLSILSPGNFCRLDSVIHHIAFESHNPLLLGPGEKGVLIYQSGRLLPPFAEEREQAARDLLTNFVHKRLIPLGCLQAAVDQEKRLLVAKLPQFDVYFGRAPASTVAAGRHSDKSRVVVQPDYSIIVIGFNPAPAAELAPFCDREKRGGTHGALTLKLTRESVLRAVTHGMEPNEIVKRLQRQASNEVPANVLRQVTDWASWVRRVQASPVTMVRCPDAETADRVLAALKRQAERLNDTTVAVSLAKLTSVERNKLKEHGVILDG